VELPDPLHPWDVTPREAARIQDALRPRLVAEWRPRGPIRRVAGVDVAFPGGDTARAAVVVLDARTLETLEEVVAELPLAFPYVPGLLTFREGPAVLAAWRELRTEPDLLLFDGAGVAHPRGMGIAAHLGLWLDRPAIGVAKSRLCGVAAEPGPERGARTPIRDTADRRRVLGTLLRTRDRVKPLWVSPGHRVDRRRAVEWVLRSGGGYRLPEPTRRADRLSKAGSRRTDPSSESGGPRRRNP